MRVTIIGAGKVGRSLARALGATVHDVTLRAARRSVPRRRIESGMLLLAVRDGELGEWAERLVAAHAVGRRTAVAHLAGGLGPEVLAPLRTLAAGVAQAHPALSFPSPGATPNLRGATLLVAGDTVAVRRVSTLARALGMVPRRGEDVQPALYHAACALVANGGAALASAGVRLLVDAGVPAEVAARLVGPLLRSVGENVGQLGVPDALSGPIRRGDAEAVRHHLKRLRAQAPELEPLYVQLARAQLEMARELGDASEPQLDQVSKALGNRAASVCQDPARPSGRSPGR